jgi:hypothetical protein
MFRMLEALYTTPWARTMISRTREVVRRRAILRPRSMALPTSSRATRPRLRRGREASAAGPPVRYACTHCRTASRDTLSCLATSACEAPCPTMPIARSLRASSTAAFARDCDPPMLTYENTARTRTH